MKCKYPGWKEEEGMPESEMTLCFYECLRLLYFLKQPTSHSTPQSIKLSLKTEYVRCQTTRQFQDVLTFFLHLSHPPLSRMWTRHFYDRDSVGEALVWTTGQYKDPLRKVKMIFWAHELWISEETPFLLETLQRAWDLYGHPIYPLPASSDPLQLLGALLSQPPLPTPFPPPSSPSSSECLFNPTNKDIVPSFPSKWSVEQRMCLWYAVRDAVKHKQTERAYRLLASVPRSSIILSEYVGISVKRNVLKQFVQGTLGIQHILCREGGLTWISWPPCAKIEGTDVKWPTGIPVGTLSARRFSIPKHLLPSSPLEPSGSALLQGCSVWQRMLDEAGIDRRASEETGSLVFRDGVQAFEVFYDKVFGTTDIPDEWSTAEKGKSHSVLKESLIRK